MGSPQTQLLVTAPIPAQPTSRINGSKGLSKGDCCRLPTAHPGIVTAAFCDGRVPHAKRNHELSRVPLIEVAPRAARPRWGQCGVLVAA